MKNLIKLILNRIGYEIKRSSKHNFTFNYIETLLLGIMTCERMINIVQIGSNDGKHSDPIYRIIMDNKDRSKVLLIEPQPEIIQYLKNNYSEHPRTSIYNGAVGENGYLSLHRIKPSYWDSFKAPYLKSAPTYRAPSGLASAKKEHVLNAAKKYLDNEIDVEDAIEEIKVPCKKLNNLLTEIKFPTNIHLLQVDAEGTDDKVLYSCDIEKLHPMIINYESMLLDNKKREKLDKYLFENGYICYNWNQSDTIALKISN